MTHSEFHQINIFYKINIPSRQEKIIILTEAEKSRRMRISNS